MLDELKLRELPISLPLKKLLGPSFILLGLGLGSGELILWPYLVANWGTGIIWGVIVGITFQFFMNMEIERYSLVNGESIFVGFARKFGRIAPIWFILSTLIPWMWPGIIAASAKIFANLFGIIDYQGIGIGLLILIGAVLTLGPTLYKTVEKFQKALILFGTPMVLILVILTVNTAHVGDLLKGLIGIGNNFQFLPAGISIASFLAAFAYTGAGGNLNLAQSFYVREKGYAMGKYTGKITSILTGAPEQIELTGATFKPHKENVGIFNAWWKNVNIEHGLVFWGMGTFTILLLALLAYGNVYGLPGTENSINFILLEGQIFAEKLGPLFRIMFLIVSGIFLFATQLTVLDATSRIMAENIVILSQKRFQIKNLAKYFYAFLWIQIIAGIVIFALGFGEPLALLTTSAILNAVAMFVHIGATLRVNTTLLHKSLRPSKIRKLMMALAFLFFGGFSFYTILVRLNWI